MPQTVGFATKVQAQLQLEVSLTLPEGRRLLSALLWSWTPSVASIFTWSTWWRVHQAFARFDHDKRCLISPKLDLQL
ncbi:MAG: hypothetical protein KME45_15085 [Stenomitos rutilans HA7619-LM2]|nr:hypothetical protein [Stenomitos rutilans HA7619-LM2]